MDLDLSVLAALSASLTVRIIAGVVGMLGVLLLLCAGLQCCLHRRTPATPRGTLPASASTPSLDLDPYSKLKGAGGPVVRRKGVVPVEYAEGCTSSEVDSDCDDTSNPRQRTCFALAELRQDLLRLDRRLQRLYRPL